MLRSYNSQALGLTSKNQKPQAERFEVFCFTVDVIYRHIYPKLQTSDSGVQFVYKSSISATHLYRAI